MKSFRARTEYHVASRIHRLDPRRESRRSLALIMLMGFATLSVMATTQALSSEDVEAPRLYSRQ